MLVGVCPIKDLWPNKIPETPFEKKKILGPNIYVKLIFKFI